MDTGLPSVGLEKPSSLETWVVRTDKVLECELRKAIEATGSLGLDQKEESN